MNILKTLFKWAGIIAGCLFVVIAWLAFIGKQDTQDTSSVEVKDNLKLAAFKLTERHAKIFSSCDKSYDLKLLEPKVGTITNDLDDNFKLFKLGSPVEAIMTGVEFVCQNNKRGTKNKHWNYLVIADDIEFDRFRCRKRLSATKYAPDGYTTIKYSPDILLYPSSKQTPREEIEAFANKCGFKVL